jgi:hypothetical protein
MGDTVQTATAVSQENFALYIEGVRCPFNYLQLGFGDDAIPSIRAEIPALEASFNDSSHLSVRNIPPRTKVVVLYKDTNWEDLPRFTVVFVGELSDPGFSKTTASKSYSFVATHITDNLASLTLASLQADTYLNTVIAGQVEEGVNPALTLSGSIYEFFTPAELAKMGNINVDRLDINDFVKLSLRKFLATGLNSPIRQAWPIQAASQYGLLEHCFSYSDEKSKLNWKKLYSLILNYTFRSLLPAIGKGSSLSYLSMSKTLAQMFLHQLDLIPNPPKYQSTVMLKPQTAFLPIPSCNVVYPLFTTQYDFVEPWSSRPTRMRQIAQPPSGIQADLINKYLRNVSPKQLRVKFEEYEKATEAEKANINLVTEEEKIRGVVDSYNDLPAFISAAIQAVSDGDYLYSKREGTVAIKGRANVNSGGVETPATVTVAEGEAIKASTIRSVFFLKFYHEELSKLEGYTGQFNVDTINRKAIIGTNSYIPKQVYLIPNKITRNKKMQLVNSFSRAHLANYLVSDAITLNLGRTAHVFQEPTGCVPLGLVINQDRKPPAGFSTLPGFTQKYFLFLGKEDTISAYNPSQKGVGSGLEDNKKDPSIVPPVEDIVKNVVGGTQGSIVICYDPSRLDLVSKLLAVLSELCGFELSLRDVLIISDELGDLFQSTELKAETDHTNRLAIIRGALNYVSEYRGQAETAFKQYQNKQNTSSAIDNTKVKPKVATIVTPDPPKKPTPYSPSYQAVLTTTDVSSTDNSQQLKVSITGSKQITALQYLEQTWGNHANLLSNQIQEVLAKFPDLRSRKLDHGFTAMMAFFGESSNAYSYSPSLFSVESATMTITYKYLVEIFGGLLKKLTVKDKTVPFIQSNTFETIKSTYPAFDSFVFLYLLFYKMRTGSDSSSIISTFSLLMDKQVKSTSTVVWENIKTALEVQNQDVFLAFTAFLSSYFEKLKLNKETDSTIVTMGKLVFGDSNFEGNFLRSLSDGVTREEISKTSAEEDKKAKETSDKAVRFKDFYESYSQPMCDYYFYHRRYMNADLSLQGPFNPYVTATYPAIILDGSPARMHIKCYIKYVTHIITPSSAITQLSVNFARRADDQGDLFDMEKTSIPLADGRMPRSPVEDVMEQLPFFGNAYSSEYDKATGQFKINKTYQETLGSGLWDEVIDHTELATMVDYPTVLKRTRRLIQHCQITNAPEGIQEAYNNIYVTSPSKIVMAWSNFSFPDTIKMTGSVFTEAELKDTNNSTPNHYVKTGTPVAIPWNPVVQVLIKNILSASKAVEAFHG